MTILGLSLICVLALSTTLQADMVSRTAHMPAKSFVTKPGLSGIAAYEIEGHGVVYGLFFEDSNFSSARVHFIMRPGWDGESLKMSASVLVTDVSPFGNIRLDWVGQCTYENIDYNSYKPWENGPKDENWPVKTLNGMMSFDVSRYPQYNLAEIETAVDIPLHGCEVNDPKKHKILWLEVSIDEVETRVVRLSRYLFMSFGAEYVIDPSVIQDMIAGCYEELYERRHPRPKLLTDPSPDMPSSDDEEVYLAECESRYGEKAVRHAFYVSRGGSGSACTKEMPCLPDEAMGRRRVFDFVIFVHDN